MTAMHVESHGSGPPLVLLHGWGMHGGMWGPAVPLLAQNFRVHCVDLPGHGYSNAEKGEGGREKGAFGSLDFIVDELSRCFAEPLTVCGWSLGGQVALRWAQSHPAQVKKLVLAASTPCFVRRDGWSCAMPLETLREFSVSLMENHALALRRFIALQIRGSEHERELLAELRAQMFCRGEPDIAALRGGLEILRDTDLRGQLPHIRQPALVIAGGRDKLTPPEASVYLAQALHDARVVEIEGAAHAPFLSHPLIFVEQLINFLSDKGASINSKS